MIIRVSTSWRFGDTSLERTAEVDISTTDRLVPNDQTLSEAVSLLAENLFESMNRPGSDKPKPPPSP